MAVTRTILAVLLVVSEMCPASAQEATSEEVWFSNTIDRRVTVQGYTQGAAAEAFFATAFGPRPEPTSLPAKRDAAGPVDARSGEAGLHAKLASVKRLPACAIPASKGCIKAFLDRALMEARDIGDPDVSGESDRVDQLLAVLAAAKAVALTIEDETTRTQKLSEIAEAGRFAPDLYVALTRPYLMLWIALAEFDAGFAADANAIVKESLVDLAGSWRQNELDAHQIGDEFLTRVAEQQAEAGYHEDALSTAEFIVSARGKGIALSKVTDALVASGRIADAFRAVRRISDPKQAAWALKKIAKVHSLADHRRDIAAVIDRIESADADPHLIETLARAGLYNLAMRMAGRIDAGSERQAALRNIAIAQAEAGLGREAKATLGSVSTGADRALGRIAVAEAVSGSFAEALGIAARIESPREQADTLREVAVLQAEVGFQSAARRTFDSARAAAEKIVDPSGDAHFRAKALAAIAENQAREGFYGEAERTADRIDVKFFQAEAFIAVARFQREAGLDSAAKRTLRRGRAGVEGDAWALEQVAAAQAAAGQYSESAETWKAIVAIIQAAPDRGVFTITSPIGRVARAQAQILQLNGAYRADGLEILIAARDAAERSESARRRVDDLAEVASALIQSSFLDDAKETAARALNAAQGIERFQERAFGFAKIAELRAALGYSENARRTFHEAFETAGAVERDERRTETLLTISIAQARSGFVDEARRGLRAIADRVERSAAPSGGFPEVLMRLLCLEAISGIGFAIVVPMAPLGAVAAAQAEAGFLEDAVRSAESERRACGRAVGFLMVARALQSRKEEQIGSNATAR